MELRAATPDDALCLSALAMQVFLDTYATDGIRPALAREALYSFSETVFRDAIVSSSNRLIVAEHKEHLIGFAQIAVSATHELAPLGTQAALLRLYVQEPFTGAKVGTQLLACAERSAALAGASVLWLTHWVYNHRASAFYKRHGYQDFGSTPFVFEGESHESRLVAKYVYAD